MNYELCKRLKDAGFPQHGPAVHDGRYEMAPGDGPVSKEEPVVYIPTLEELIEECDTKGGVFMLHTYMDGWAAQITGANITTPHMCAPTPTEAVAHLWLALHASPKEQNLKE